VFVSLDLDVMDAAYAPGVSAMNPAGWAPWHFDAWLRSAGANPRVKCFDIMELCPPHDEGGRTARLAAHFFLSFLRGLAEREA
jgi:formiminoglutamase